MIAPTGRGCKGQSRQILPDLRCRRADARSLPVIVAGSNTSRDR
jgi:hypothetical protein